MNRVKSFVYSTSGLFLLLICVGTAQAAKISGTISTTLTIFEDSQLVGDVTCTVSGAPCISIGAPHVTLDLNAFTMTGQADAQKGCIDQTFVPNFSEDGIDVNAQTSVTIRGPGLIQRFRGPGVFLRKSIGITVTRVTVSTNCASGILVQGGSLHDLRGNIAVRNGNLTNPCGGI
jgi:hypothetical protein